MGMARVDGWMGRIGFMVGKWVPGREGVRSLTGIINVSHSIYIEREQISGKPGFLGERWLGGEGGYCGEFREGVPPEWIFVVAERCG